MKNVVIFPYDIRTLPLIRFWDVLTKEYYLNSVVSLPGTGLIGKDVGFADNRKEIGIVVESDISNHLIENDTLIITEGNLSELIHCDSMFVMKEALYLKKEVICFAQMDKDDIMELDILSQKCHTQFRYYGHTQNINRAIDDTRIIMPTTPIIYIGGVFEEANTFEVFLAVFFNLIRQGYKVSGIGQKSYLSFFDLVPKPFDAKCSYTDSDKICALNKLALEIEKKHHPDVIIMQIPDALIRYSDYLTCGFGVNMFLYSNALQPSYFICCIMTDLLDENQLPYMKEMLRNKYGISTDAFHVSSLKLNEMISDAEERECFYYTSQISVDQKIAEMQSELDTPLFNMINDDECLNLVSNIIESIGET